MSNPDERKTITEEEKNENSDDSGYLCSDEEGEIREIVLALPALRLSESTNVDETIRSEAAIAAKLIVDAAEEAVQRKTDQTVSGSGGIVGTPKGKKIVRPRVLVEAIAGASGSTVIGSTEDKEPVKKAKKKGSSELTNPPQGPPKCNICARSFSSWKAVFGHLRQHKDRGYQGFLPPPTFNAAEEGFGGTVAASSSGGGGFGSGTGGLGIDLNADPVEGEERTASGSTPKFDLNRSPPQDEEDEKDDKAK